MGACAGRHHRARLASKGRRSTASLLCCLRVSKGSEAVCDKMATRHNRAGRFLLEETNAPDALTNGSVKHSLHVEKELPTEHAEDDDESGFYEADNKIPKLRTHKPPSFDVCDISLKAADQEAVLPSCAEAGRFDTYVGRPSMKRDHGFRRLTVDLSKRKPVVPEGELLAWIGQNEALKLNDIRELLRSGQDGVDEPVKFVQLSLLALDPIKNVVRLGVNPGSFKLVCTNAGRTCSASVISEKFRQYLIANYAAEVADCLLDQIWVRKGSSRHLATLKFFRDGKFVLPSLLATMPFLVESQQRTLQLFRVTRSKETLAIDSRTTSLIVPLRGGWPQGFCAEYFKRTRVWPPKEVIEAVSQRCAALEPGDKDEWRFFFGLAEEAVVEALSAGQKSLLREAMALYLWCQDARGVCINRGSLFPASLLAHAFLRFLETTPENDLNLSFFADYLHHHLQRCSLRHYFDSSVNLRNSADVEQWQESKERVGNLYRHHRLLEPACQRPFGDLRLRYIISFHEIIAEQLSEGQLVRRIDPALIEKINVSLQNEGNLLACSLEINEDLFYKSIEQCADIVQSYIRQIRVDSIPILYHCLWSSYIHYAFPFISEIFRRPLF